MQTACLNSNASNDRCNLLSCQIFIFDLNQSKPVYFLFYYPKAASHVKNILYYISICKDILGFKVVRQKISRSLTTVQ